MFNIHIHRLTDADRYAWLTSSMLLESIFCLKKKRNQNGSTVAIGLFLVFVVIAYRLHEREEFPSLSILI